jgi:hypothetical protein
MRRRILAVSGVQPIGLRIQIHCALHLVQSRLEQPKVIYEYSRSHPIERGVYVKTPYSVTGSAYFPWGYLEARTFH